MYKDSLEIYRIGEFSYLKEITLYSRFDVDDHTFNTLSMLVGNGQVIELEKQKVTLKDIEFSGKYEYSLYRLSDMSGKEIPYLFRLLILQDGTLLLQFRFERHHYFEVIHTIEEVKEKHLRFILSMLEHHVCHFSAINYSNEHKLKTLLPDNY